MNKYVLVEGSCYSKTPCVFKDDHRCAGAKCKIGFHFELNPAYKPPSQRVRELIVYKSNMLVEGMVYPKDVLRLANELEQEEKEQ